MQYRVLIACRNDRTKKEYEPGAVIDEGAFPADVIANWLAIDPPVLAEEQSDGSDAKRKG